MTSYVISVNLQGSNESFELFVRVELEDRLLTGAFLSKVMEEAEKFAIPVKNVLKHHRAHILVETVGDSFLDWKDSTITMRRLRDEGVTIMISDRKEGCILCEENLDIEHHPLLPSEDTLSGAPIVRSTNDDDTDKILSVLEQVKFGDIVDFLCGKRSRLGREERVALKGIVEKLYDLASKATPLSRQWSESDVSVDELKKEIANLQFEKKVLKDDLAKLQDQHNNASRAQTDVDSRTLCEFLTAQLAVLHDDTTEPCDFTTASFVKMMDGNPVLDPNGSPRYNSKDVLLHATMTILRKGFTKVNLTLFQLLNQYRQLNNNAHYNTPDLTTSLRSTTHFWSRTPSSTAL
ncbi:uncharacterized protein EV422DRAFT_508610 [Fimicolochytrium jonesii]|uniref:uncharacterized protein n=1 Tax=Fimicolochytrium jonesii TaxID=1396493 RepID=UPI0022FEB899|nr:uncharacterized protein EV422DRAFT_508610 [Fimicolochytrium jonesii]KAI8817771.1 hypothetical protein EV422DRAFT_508610 [Fimicolochytrium jonesii]